MADIPLIERLFLHDAIQILELINGIQPSIPWTMEHLHWQFFVSPGGAARLYGIKDAGRLVSFYAAVPHRFRLTDRTVTARMIQDVMTHPAYRGRGFLHLLADCCLQDMIDSGEIGFTFPNKRSENSFRRTGWTELCEVPWREKCPALVSSNDCLQSLFTQVDTFDECASKLWDSSGISIGVQRDRAYLNWRYNKPGNFYFKFIIKDEYGLLVLKLYNGDGPRVLHLCELLLRADKKGIIPRVLAFCERFAIENNADLITAWMPESHLYSHAFNQAGLMLSRKSDRYIFVHPGRNSESGLENVHLWHLTQGDSDIY